MAPETHQHYDAEGNLTGTTVVTRESEWDDEMRQIALEVHDLAKDRCPTCGGKRSKCNDPRHTPIVEPFEVACRDSKAIEKYQASFHNQNSHKGDPKACEECARYAFVVTGYQAASDPLP